MMIKNLILGLVLSLSFTSLFAQRTTVNTTISGWLVRITYDPNAEDSVPAIITMPGAGEVGTNPDFLTRYGPHYWLNNGWDGKVTLGNGDHYPIYVTVVAPTANSRPWALKPVIDGILNNYKIKRNSVHWMALSQGSWVGGMFSFYKPTANDYTYHHYFRSIVNIQGVNPSDAASWVQQTLPFPQRAGHWAKVTGGKYLGFEQLNDGRNIYRVRDNMNDSVPGSAHLIYTYFGSGGHTNFNDFYNPAQNNWTTSNANTRDNKGANLSNFIAGGQNIYQWALRQGDTTLPGDPPVNQLPIVSAGSNQTISVPANSVTLTGTASDPDGTVVSTLWELLSGPNVPDIDDPTNLTTLVESLIPGTYQFRLTATDDDDATASSTVIIQVNSEAPPEVADAGADFVYWMNQTRPDTIVLDGSNSQNATIFEWSLISGPSDVDFIVNDEIAHVTNVVEGVYIFRLSVNEDQDIDDVQVTVRNFQNTNLSACRPGGGKSFIVPPSSEGTGWKRWNRQYINRDNILGEPVMGGDTLFFAATDSCLAFEIGDFGGGPGCPVHIMPLGGPVVMKNNAYMRVAIRDSNMVQHAIFDGTTLRDSTGEQYGWVVDFRNVENVTVQALTCVLVHNFTVKGYAALNSGITQIKMNTREGPGMFDKFVQKNITLTDNYIDGCHGEGFYIGHTAPSGEQAGNTLGPSPRMDSIVITNNIVTNCGWDGIQLSNARNGAIIANNLVYKTGVLNVANQRAGIILGGNTNGRVDSNLVFNSTGNLIQLFGYGQVYSRGNIIDSVFRGANDQDGYYISYNLSTIPEINPPLSVFIDDNIIGRAERDRVRIANNNGLMNSGSISNNSFIYATDISGFITDNGTNSTKTGNTARDDFEFTITITGDYNSVNIHVTKGDQEDDFDNAYDAIEWLRQELIPSDWEQRDYFRIRRGKLIVN